ncbi:hypothetical protein COCNU_scaffold005698G000010 [Cocos nucifera]|nr:hypothetical protein [Cocos nucifera]
MGLASSARKIERGKEEDREMEKLGGKDHNGTEMPSSFHPCPSMGYAQFNIRGAVGAYSIHFDIGCLGTSTIDIYSTSVSTPSVASTPLIAEPLPSSIFETHATMQASECALSNRTFHSPTHMAHRRYDFFDHKRARDVRLRKIVKLYQGYKVKLHRE